jgi:RHS repeat-associated protein
VGVLVRNQPAPDATISSVSAIAAMAKGERCQEPDKIVIEGFGGPSGGWSYFGIQAPVEVSGSVSYYCEGEAVDGLTSQFDISVVCDGKPLSVQFDPNVGDLWSATVTPPLEESVCHVHATAISGPGIPGILDETYVFQSGPAMRPIVSITSPTDGDIVYPDTVSLTADAVVDTVFGPDPPQLFTITKVEFFDESDVVPTLNSKLGEVTTPPYALPPISLEPAVHTIYAVATDSRGYKARSAPLKLKSIFNRPPEIRLHTPTFGARFQAPTTVKINADFSDLDGPVGPERGLRRISFFNNTALIHETVWLTGPTTHSETYNWENPSFGVRQIYVEAEDHRGLVRRIGPVNIFVLGDAMPMAKVTAPNDGLFQATNVAIPLSASAVDDRTISNLDFVIRPWPGTTNAGEVVVLGTVPSASLLYRGTWTATASWTPTIAGRYVILARAKDGAAGATTLSDPIEIYADDNSATNFAPKVRIERPVNGDGVRQNTSMPITVKVQDGIGEAGIDKAYLYLDGSATSTWNAVAVSNGASPPIWTATGTFPIGALSAGPHTLMARAGDNGVGGSIRGDSPVITFNVLATGVNAAPLATIDFVTTPGSLNVGASVAFIVKARDANVDGSISKIEILANGDLISSPTTPLTLTPVPGRPNEATATMNWTTNASGDFDVVARVTDNALLTGDSPPLKIRVNGIASNTAPVVALTEPASGSTFEVMPGGFVALRAAVNDPAASPGHTPGITLVEFYDGTKRLGSVSTGLPSGTAQGTVMYYWSNPPEGAHAIHARARDSQGTVTQSTPINLFMLGGPPSISIVAPVAGATGFVAPESIEARVNVQDDYGIRSVYYFLDGVFAGAVGAEPFAFAYTGITAGQHTLTAQAWDFGNHSAMSAPVIINVATNVLPTVSITTPITTTPRGEFGEGNNIPLAVDVDDPDEGQIDKVEYLRNGTVIYTAHDEPFNGTLLNAAPGVPTQLTARATDIRGGIGNTASATLIDVIAAQAPNVALTAPLAASTHYLGDSITLSADASDPDQRFGGRIVSVQFFKSPTGNPGAGTALAAPITTPPYRLQWTPTDQQLGTFDIFARAIDSGPAGRNTRDSSPRGITVMRNSAPSSITLKKPAMPSHYGTEPPASHTIVAPNGILRLEAKVDDLESNVERVEFFVQSGPSGARTLIKTVSRATPNDGLFVGDAQLPPGLASTEISFVQAKAFDAKGLSVETLLELPIGEQPLTSCGGQFGACANTATPIAIVDPARSTTPCNVGSGGTGQCLSNRYTISSTPVRIQAERYDQGGHGVAFFERDAVWDWTNHWTQSIRGDEVEFENCDANLGPACIVSKVDDGETLRYSVTMQDSSPGNPEGIAVVRKVRLWIPKPETRITFPCDDTPIDSRQSMMLEAQVVSGLVPNATRVEFYVNNLLLGSSTPTTQGGSQSTLAQITWGSVTPGTYLVKARTVIDQPGSGQDIVGEFSPEISVERREVANGPIQCNRIEGRWVKPADSVGGIELMRSSGSQVNAVCAPPVTIKENPNDPSDHWYQSTLCPVPLPAGNYWLEYHSPQDGIKLDWFELSTITATTPLPTAELISPTAGALFAINASVTLTANVIGAVDHQTRVDFFINRAGQPEVNLFSTGTNGTAPYSVTRQFTALGTYNITAQATVNGVSGPRSQIATPIVIQPAVGNQPPQVALTQPSGSLTQVNSGATLQLQATASDTDGVISGVTFNVTGNPPINAVFNAGVWGADWVATTVEQQTDYTVTATAFDSANPQASTTTASRTIRVIPTTPGTVHMHDTAAAIPTTIDPRSDGVGATVGEFRVDESGAATYSIPILTVPGRAGVQPQVSLSYHSQSGSGPIGRGWSISGASAISRCRAAFEHGNVEAANGSPPIDFSNRDQFCLDGQKLLLVDGTHGGNAEYRTEIDGIARIRSFQRAGNNGPNYFVVQRKDGSTSWYGDRVNSDGLPFMLAIDEPRADAYLPRNDGSGINEPAANEPAISWALNRSMDSKGNHIDYRYLTDRKIGLQLLQKVKYTGKTRLLGQSAAPGDKDPFAEIQMNYVPLATSEVAHSYQAGMLTRQTQELASISSFSENQIVRHYRLSYSGSQSAGSDRLLSSLQECANTDTGPGAVCYRPTAFEWTQAASQLSNYLERDDVDERRHSASRLGDVDGDGLLDMVWIENKQYALHETRHCTPGKQLIWVQYAGFDTQSHLVMERRGQLPTCSPRRVYEGSQSPGAKEFDDSWMLFDYNGDGRDDVLVADNIPTDGSTNARWHAYPSNGRPANAAPGTWRAFNVEGDMLPSCAVDAAHCVNVSSHGGLAQSADVNGDGLLDLLFGEDTTDSGAVFDKLSVKLFERIAESPDSGYRFSETMDVAADWADREPQNQSCETPEGTEIDFDGNGSSPNEIFRNCASSLELSTSKHGRSPRILEVDGDGRADLLMRVAYRSTVVRHESTCTSIESSVGATGLNTVLLSNGSPEEANALAEIERTPTNPSGGFPTCQIGNQTRQYFYEMVVDRIEPATVPGGRRTVWLREYGRQLLSNLRETSVPEENFNLKYYSSVVNTGDLNGDGLQELMLIPCRGSNCEPGSELRVFENNGKNFAGVHQRTIGNFSTVPNDYDGLGYLHVLDYNGDGRADLLFPQTDGQDNDQFTYRLAKPDGTFGNERCTWTTPAPTIPNCTGVGQGEPGNWTTFFADMDGDALVDYFAWQTHNDGGSGGQHDNFRSARSPSRSSSNAALPSATYRQRGMLKSIVNGFGAKTSISYEPMTNAAVYRKGLESRNTFRPGRGSPVLDLLAPMYLVSKVESDAPSLDAPLATSAIYYQYEGARMQSGGRGLLGFSEIRTIDANFVAEHFVTITSYRQDFPFMGMPIETRKYRVGSIYTPSNCLTVGPDAAPATCLVGSAASNAFFAEPALANGSSRLVSYARNRLVEQITADLPGSNDARFPYVAASFELSANTEDAGSSVNAVAVTGTFIKNNATADAEYSDTVTMRSDTPFASLGSLRSYADTVTLAWYGDGAEMGDIACDGTASCVKRTLTHSTYLPASSADYWRLGRLAQSEVTHWRYGAGGQPVDVDGATRASAFEYDMALPTMTGLLSAEIFQPEDTGNQYLRTAHFYDDFGNPTLKLLCSRDVAAGDCNDASDYNRVLQRPVGGSDRPLARVHRYTRTDYDSDGRFPVNSWVPYFDPTYATYQSVERGEAQVRARDLLGNVIEALDINGNWSRARIGALGRTQGGRTQTGTGAPPAVGQAPVFDTVSSLAEYHWCAGQNGGSNEAPCPTGAVFRQTSYADGGARTVAYYDKLGRVFFGIKESFNNDNGLSNAWAGQVTRHDRRGRPISVSEPFFVAASAGLRPDVAQGSAPWSVGQRYWTNTAYDGHDRPTRVELPEHTPSAPAFTAIAYSGLTTTTSVTVYRDDDGNGTKESVTMQSVEIKDATGKVVMVRDHDALETFYSYDDIDNLTSVRRNAGRGDIYNVILYDQLGRKTEQRDPDAGTEKYFHNAAGETICSLDARNMVSITDFDAQGRAWREQSFPGVGVASCAFDTSVAVSSTEIAAPATGASRSIDVTEYDFLVPPGAVRRIVRKQTRDSAASTTGYEEVDTYTQEFQYDALSRPSITTTHAVPVVTEVCGSSHTCSEGRTYDRLGRAATISDVTDGKIENMYSSHGFLRRVRDANAPSTVYWEGQEVDVRGQTVKEYRHSSAITIRHAYDARNGRLQSILTGNDNGSGIVNPIQNLAYDFDALGNLLRREDQRLELQEDFQYDKLNRLVTGKVRNLGGVAVRDLSIGLTYDKLGNICTKTWQGLAQAEQYVYGGLAGCGLNSSGGNASGNSAQSPHAVKSRSTTAGTITYLYDNSGNQYAAGGVPGATNRTLRFNADGMADKVMSGTPLTHKTEYRYGPSGRYLRIDDNGAGQKTTTRYLGGVEWITKSSSANWRERRRSIGGFLILTDTVNESGVLQPLKYRYQLGDHLGSIDTLVDQFGAVIERMSFDPHGNRRNADGNDAWSTAPLVNHAPANTTRGFTGHEHIDRANIVHMNGRLYDPALGRMLSADPLVQEMFNAQNLNRYTYVLNNPLSFTDPSGLAWFSKYWRSIVSLAITIFAPYLAPLAWSNLAVAVVAGFVSGVVTTGSLQGGLMGAFSAVLFYGIGQYFDGLSKININEGVMGTGLTGGQFAAKVMAHGVAGGIMGKLQGGKFGHGFASAGVTQLLSPAIERVDRGNEGFSAKRVAVAAMVGGTSSAASGGKFANGAITAAFARAFNDEAGKRAHQAFLKQMEACGAACWQRPMSPEETKDAFGSGTFYYETEMSAECRQDASNYMVASMIPVLGFFIDAPNPLDYIASGTITTSAAVGKVAKSYDPLVLERIKSMESSLVFGNSKQQWVQTEKLDMAVRRDVVGFLKGAARIFGFLGAGIAATEYTRSAMLCEELYNGGWRQ